VDDFLTVFFATFLSGPAAFRAASAAADPPSRPLRRHATEAGRCHHGCSGHRQIDPPDDHRSVACGAGVVWRWAHGDPGSWPAHLL
jgi:hypothetical protein